MSVLTVCGIDELPQQRDRAVTHVLSVLDPDWPEPEAFEAYAPHHRTVLRFHDVIDPAPDRILPQRTHVEDILRFGAALAGPGAEPMQGHLLIHCHAGVSRSTAAMATLLAQARPDEDEDRLFLRLVQIRPQAWPNSVMIGLADALLERQGRLLAALTRHYGRQLRRDPALGELMIRLGRQREVEMAERW
jgi:predicted protein tyrosine phosphatase